MRKQNSEANKLFLRLCAALCVWLLCAGFLYPAPGHAAEPVPTPRMITRRPSAPVTPSPMPSPTEVPSVLVQVHYVTEKGSVLISAGYPLKESGTVEADPDVVPDGYELAGETACYVQIENGTASPDPVRFVIRKKAALSPAPTVTPVPEALVPVYYVTDQGTVLSEGKVRITSFGTIQADPGMVPEAYELTGKTTREVRLENGAAAPASVEFTVWRKATPSPTAVPSVVHQGAWGTCRWEIDSSGQLTISAGKGSDTEGECPWQDYVKEIKTVRTVGKVVFPKDSSYLFSLSFQENDKWKSACTAIYFDETDTSGADNMEGMFYRCVSLTTLDISRFDTANATDLSHMFYGCGNLKILDVSKFRTSKAIYMNSMFSGCKSLTTLDVSGLDTENATDLSFMFYGCGNLKTLDVSKFRTSKTTKMRCMFDGCKSLTILDVSRFDTANATDLSFMFRECWNLKTLDVSNFRTSNATTMESMFYSCSSLTALDVSGFDTANATVLNHMFYGCGNLKTLDVSKFRTSKATNMKSMFSGCNSLTILDVSGFDTANVTDLSFMFYGCGNLKTLDVSKFRTSKATTMDAMFYDCGSLTPLDVSGFDTANVTDMSFMFYGCGNLTALDVSKFRTSKVTYMNTMFCYCGKLTALNLSSFDTENVTNMRSMFNGCKNLISLDLRNFDTAKAEQMYAMFSGCSALKTVRLGAKFSFKGKCAAIEATLPDKQWVSASSGLTYSAREIAEKRSGIADTYTAE